MLKGHNGWGGILGSRAQFPVVGELEHGLKTVEEAEAFFGGANIVVANVDSLSACASAVKDRIAEWFTHLFVDETHHSAAASWEDIRRRFRIKRKPILGFTATPYRNDQKLVEGKIVYIYPLLKAQEEGYFTPIAFRSVRAFSQAKADIAVAQAAIEQLESDIKDDFSHLVMARAANIPRAEEIHELYKELAPQYNPELIHSKLGREEQRAILRRIRSGASRIVVCVAMFGEGFDLPELKIAAMHDIHKTLAITLQFTGRFTRGRTDLGSATLIANTANVEVQDALRALYAEDPNWNKLLRELSDSATGRQTKRTEFLRGFDNIPSDLPVQNLCPKLSAETYTTTCEQWNPEALEKVLPKAMILVPPAINQEIKVALFVTRQENEVPWADARDLRDISHHLHLIHFDSERKLLFINSSDTKYLHDEWAKAICGDSTELIEGETVFRALDGLNRLMLLNAGLKDTLSQAVRFMMLVGADVREALKNGNMENRIKSNLFTRGFRQGQRTSVGCSAKGRVWAHAQAEDVTEWITWCGEVGDRLTDDTINMEEVLKNALIPEIVESRPDAVPIAVEWNDDTLRRGEDYLYLGYRGEQIPFFDAELQVVNPSRQGNLVFRVCMEVATTDHEGVPHTELYEVEYEMRFDGKKFSYHSRGEEVYIYAGRKKSRLRLSEWLNRDPLVIRFHDGSWLEGNIFCKPRKERVPFDASKIDAWDWAGTDIKKESQYKTKSNKRQRRQDSIQYRVIQELCSKDYDIVFDDDSSGESADVVALKVLGDRLQVHLFHCKFAKGTEAGERVSELYEVCGQAQKSIHWRRDVDELFQHLVRRNADWEKKYKVTRFQKGDEERLGEIILEARELRPDFEIAIVQPGLSKAGPTRDQLDLLATTEIYLSEVGAVPFKVIASA